MCPKVSVVMPIFKHSEEMLTSAIYSILDQTFSDFELIIIDGSSDENNFNIISKINDKRIRYFKIKGYINSLNFGIEQARGEYIARMDSDDISYPQRLEEQVNFLDNNLDVSLCSTLVEYFGLTNKTSSYKNELNLLNLIRKQEFKHVSMMFRKEINLKYDNVKPYEDCLLYRKLLLQGYKFEIINKVLLKNYISCRSIMKMYPKYCQVLMSKINVLTLSKYYDYKLNFVDEIFSKKYYSKEDVIEYLKFAKFLKQKLKQSKLNIAKICLPFLFYILSKLKSKFFILHNKNFYYVFGVYLIKICFKYLLQTIFSLKNECFGGKKYKIITILGVKFKFHIKIVSI